MKLRDSPVPFSLPYPPERMSWALDVIGWSARTLADRIETHEASVRQMLRGRRAIPDVLGMWLETLAQMMLALPVPFTWREKGGEDED